VVGLRCWLLSEGLLGGLVGQKRRLYVAGGRLGATAEEILELVLERCCCPRPQWFEVK
jgi:hypothetical protein